ncbi:MAG: bifunctional oligoribonuclease/PAP phosphatase NrnA [Candidatus Eremiobacterales bacterium]
MSQENTAPTNGKANALADAAEVAACLRAHRQFVMCAHEKPDGDVLGSGYALGLALKSIGKSVTYFLDDEVPRNLRFMPEWQSTQRSFEGVADDAIFVFFDMSDQARAGKALQWVPRERIVNIDHHLGNKRFGRWNYVNEGEAATGSLVLGLVFSLGVKVTPDIATCLLGTLISDTGCFQYSNASPHTMRLGAALIEAGADKDLITEQLYYTRTFAGQKVLGRALENAQLTDDGVCYSIVTQAMLEEYGATHEDLEDVVGALRVVDRCEVAALFKESADGAYRLSLRSRGRFNVMEMARALGGGGHFRAAGATVAGPRESAIERVLAAIRSTMDEKSRTH